jgi:hypothetical protein
VTVAGRACAKRIKTPYQCWFVAAAERPIQYGVARQARCARLARYASYSTLGAARGATRLSYPVSGNVITPRSIVQATAYPVRRPSACVMTGRGGQAGGAAASIMYP